MAEIVAYIKANRGLIESVTTSKVNVADIIDNLSTSSSDKPLSASQGVALKRMIDTLTASDVGAEPSGSSLNEVSKHNNDEQAHPSIRAKIENIPTDMVRYSKQTLTDEQKAQARENIGAINIDSLTLGFHTDGLLYLFDGHTPVGAGVALPEGGASGDVIGTLDDGKNILLSGNLADGTYTLKWLNADGTYTDAGTIAVGEIEEPEMPAYTNLFNASTCELNMRLSSSGASTAGNGYILTDYIPIPDVVAVGNFRIRYKNAELYHSKSRVGLYDSSKQLVDVQYINGTDLYATGTDDNGVKYVDVLREDKITNSAYVRIAFYSGADTAVSTADAENIIITINEEIV
jgi:hypothetical protein